jgi:hypothetical protein
MATYSRRRFLQLTSATALSLAFTPPLGDDWPYQLGRVTTQYLRVRHRPSSSAKHAGWKVYDDIVTIYSQASDEQGRRWYEIAEGYVPSADVQPVARRRNLAASTMPTGGCLGEVTVPFTDARRKPDASAPVAYRLYYASTCWVREVTSDLAGEQWYKLYDERLGISYYAPAAAVRLIASDELLPIHPDQENKNIIVNLKSQRLTAREGKREVFTATVSTGRLFIDDSGISRSHTPAGQFVVDRKRPTRHMGNGDAAGSDYELPGVPWVSYFHWKGFSFHGTWWHNDFGHPRSAGCINLRPEDALWIYRWSQPTPLPDQEITTGAGTRVEIVEE